MLSDVVDAGSRLHVVRLTAVLLFADVDGTSIMASFAQAAAFGSRSPVSDVDILGNGVSFEASLCLNRREQWVRHVLAHDSASAANDAGARFYV